MAAIGSLVDFTIDGNLTLTTSIKATADVFDLITANGSFGSSVAIRLDDAGGAISLAQADVFVTNGNVYVGQDDTLAGTLQLYGGAATTGGTLRIFNGATSDTTVNYWDINSSSGSLWLQPNTTTGGKLRLDTNGFVTILSGTTGVASFATGSVTTYDSNGDDIFNVQNNATTNTVIFGVGDLTTVGNGNYMAYSQSTGLLELSSQTAATVDTDKFMVFDTDGSIKYRTGAEVLSDIGGASSSHTHTFDSLTSKTGGTGNYTTTGNFTALRLVSTQTTGTSPLSVSSTTVNTNFNADLWDDRHRPAGFAESSTTYEIIASGDWDSPIGTSRFAQPSSVGGPGTAGYWFTTGRRDTGTGGSGYSGIFTTYSTGDSFIGSADNAADDPTWARIITSTNASTQLSQFLRSDASDSFTGGSGTAIVFNDSGRIDFGTGNDFRFYHNGTHMYTDMYTGDWYLRDSATNRYIFARASSTMYFRNGATGYGQISGTASGLAIQSADGSNSVRAYNGTVYLNGDFIVRSDDDVTTILTISDSTNDSTFSVGDVILSAGELIVDADNQYVVANSTAYPFGGSTTIGVRMGSSSSGIDGGQQAEIDFRRWTGTGTIHQNQRITAAKLNGTGSYGLGFYASQEATNIASDDLVMYLSAVQNVGIGTNNPTTKLHLSFSSATAYNTTNDNELASNTTDAMELVNTDSTTSNGYTSLFMRHVGSSGQASARMNLINLSGGSGALTWQLRDAQHTANQQEKMRLTSDGILNLSRGFGPSSSTAAGNTGTEDGANTWAKLATFNINSNFSGGAFYYVVNTRNNGYTSSAGLTVILRRNADVNTYTVDLAMTHLTDNGGTANRFIGEDSFLIVSNDASAIELWVQKKTNYGLIELYPLGISQGTNASSVLITYYSGSAWQSTTPTGTGNSAQSNGITAFDNQKVFHSGLSEFGFGTAGAANNSAFVEIDDWASGPNTWALDVKGDNDTAEEYVGIKILGGGATEYNKWVGIAAVSESSFGNTQSMAFYTSESTSAHTEKMRLSPTGDLHIVGNLAYTQTLTNKTASYAIVSSDAGTCLTTSGASAINFTVNTGSLEDAGDFVEIDHLGTGTCTIVAGTSVTLWYNANDSLVLNGQYSRVMIQKTATTNTYRVFGQLTPA